MIKSPIRIKKNKKLLVSVSRTKIYVTLKNLIYSNKGVQDVKFASNYIPNCY